jgi:hypothetical protein
MAVKKRIVIALATVVSVAGMSAVPSAAQRYCQRELYEEGREGCTAPVGGPISSGDPRFGARVKEEPKTDAQKLIEQTLAADEAE